eukprot:TRINITY_DN27625_c0_g1_i2.p1 TRINITY_DN27625_c0_g1~~TRINITY_DN27625_c0_g1_i2.p1  ORF type:complete len:580 (-),score=65.08 TRINITY_DN27625_c0_g1_i2:513-2252(-)
MAAPNGSPTAQRAALALPINSPGAQPGAPGGDVGMARREAPVHRKPTLTCKTLFVLGAMNMIDCINVNLLVPYVDRMVSDFLHTSPDDPQVAHVVGLLIGTYSLCEVAFSVVWGSLADRIGRKPTLLIGLGGSIIAPIIFGMGTSLTTVFLARSLDGFFCGNMGVTRTYLGEIVDETNEAKGFGFLAVCFSMGLFIGPVLGGELVYPAQFAPGLFADTIFDDHPFLLPNLTYACFAAAAWMIGAVFLEETLPRERRRGCCGGPPAVETATDSFHRTLSHGTDPLGTPCAMIVEEDATPLSPTQESARSGEPPASRCYPKVLIQAMIALCGLSGCTAANTQLFAVITSYPRNVDGFAFGPREIGALQNVAAVSLLFTQCVLYPSLTKRFGFLRCFVCGWSLNVVANLLFPVYGLFADPDKYGFFRYVPLGAMQFMMAVGGGMCFPTAFVFINRASVGMERGAVNGWANSAGALCRAFFPPAAGFLLAVGSQSDKPMGRYLATYVNMFVGSVCIAICYPGLRQLDRQGMRRKQSARSLRSSGSELGSAPGSAPATGGTASGDARSGSQSATSNMRRPLVPS